VVSAAYAGLGVPYQWGGTTTAGFDCSGFINWAYNQAGHGGLPRTTYGMESSLPRVSSPQPGDIVLANNSGHGGIYVGNGQVISATPSGGVRVHGLNERWHQVNAILRPGG
jgi:peptidoglycan DL-endopeptidase CwlO